MTFEEAEISKNHKLIDELFSIPQSPPPDSEWNQQMYEVMQHSVKNGLHDETRKELLKKYETSKHVASFGPPKINKELLPALNKSVIIRDDYQMKSQTQVGCCINALGAGLSHLLKLEATAELDEETNDAITKIADSLRLLSDHHYRISMARQAFIKPLLNIVGKSAATVNTVGEWLFGDDFGEKFKTAQACQKVSKEIAKAQPSISDKNQQPVRQNFPQKSSAKPFRKPGNFKPPKNLKSAGNRSGERYHKNRYHSRPNSRSRSRSNRHHSEAA